MDKNPKFDYYYGIESEQFSFYRIPRLLIKDNRFKKLSSDAKLLYGLLLDRMSLSIKNGWFDEQNRAYIVYSIENMMDDLGCSKPTCVKIVKELDSEKGIGLIEKKRRGLGKPDIIYVKNFATISQNKSDKKPSNADEPKEVKNFNFKKSNSFTSESKELLLQEVKNFNLQKSTILNSRSKDVLPVEVKKIDSNYTNNNYTDMNHTETNYINHINQEKNKTPSADVIDVIDDANAYVDIIKENINYAGYMRSPDLDIREMYDELFHVICDVVCVKRRTVNVGGREYPYELVRSRFLKLNDSHLEYVMECMKHTTTKITNIKAYMITALYNAPATMNHYYQQEVQHDMYACGKE